jgi:hypothetical protein
MLLQQTTGWDVRSPWSVAFAALVAYAAALLGAVYYIRRRDRQRKLAHQAKAQ